MKDKKESLGTSVLDGVVDILLDIVNICVELILELVKSMSNGVFKSLPKVQKIEHKAIQVKKTTEIKNALGIDTKTYKEFSLSEIDFRRHSFIVGASGFGKTNLISILQEHSLRLEKPIIFFDPKGDIDALSTFKKLCESYGRPCYIFSEHYRDSISLNPVLEGSNNQVVDRIMRSFEWSEPYYRDASRRSLTQAIKCLKTRDKDFSLKAIFDELVQLESKENIGLIAKIEAIIESDFGRVLNAPNEGLTLSKIRQENACLYIGLSTQGYGETAMAVGKLFLGELLYNSYKTLSSPVSSNTGLNNPVSIFFDEFGSLVTPAFIELQNKCRGAGMELTLAVQSASDIDRIDSDLTKQIIENAGNKFVLKQRLDDAASFFSNSIGTTTTSKYTHIIEDGEKGNRGTVREVNELLVHPDIIKSLNIGQCVLLRQGPTRLNLVNLRNQKLDNTINKIRNKKHKIYGAL